ncbi:hypothetical protein WJX77_012590 [Trebouxia sp. C0004]
MARECKTTAFVSESLGHSLGATQNCEFVDLPNTPSGAVKVASDMGVAHQLHRGSSHEGVMLHAKESRHDCITVSGDGGATWYAQLLLLFSYEDLDGCESSQAQVSIPFSSRI